MPGPGAPNSDSGSRRAFAPTSTTAEGRSPRQRPDALASLEIALQHGWELGLPISLAFLIEARVETGDVAGADQVLAEAGTGRELPNNAFWNLLLYSRAKLRLAQGKSRVAFDDLLECGRRQQLWMAPNPAVAHWRSDAAIAAAQLGETERARELAREELRLIRAFGAPRALGIALQAAGLVEPGPRGLELLHEAVATLEASPARLEHARALTDLGAALRRAGKREAAREPLRRALDLAQRCGADALDARARDELRAAGARPRRHDVSGLGSLTASERRVADMAGAGMTNREIAQALFVTLKTVEGHLRGAFLKLDIGSRRELPAILAAKDQGGTLVT
jgi:DNA-binding CsgD family transcriptional regulator